MPEPYLIAHPPVQRQFRDRGEDPSGVIVVHTAENAPDLLGEDGGAEAVARFIQGRPDFGSYHLLADRDSIVHLVPFHLQAYGDGTGSNPHAIHISGATQADKWARMTPEQRKALVVNMAKAAARAARWLRDTHGIVVPARRITRVQSDQRAPGFIPHADRDPARRTDPGDDFPWDLFLSTFADLMAPRQEAPTVPQSDRNAWDDLYDQATRMRRALPKHARERRRALRKIKAQIAPWTTTHRPKD